MEKIDLENITPRKSYFSIITLIIFFSVIISVPSIVFIYITYANINLKLYTESYDLIKPIISPRLLNPDKIFIFQWIGFSCFSFFLIMMLFVGVLFNNRKISVNKKIVYISFILLMLIAWISFISVAQNEYANFQLFFKYQNLTNYYENSNYPEDNREAWIAMENIKKQFTINYDNNYIFGWLSNNNVWWMLFAQLSVAIISFITLQDHLFKKTDIEENIDRIIKINIKKSEFGDSFIKKIYNRLFVVTEKNISLLMIISSTLLILPQLIYTIAISSGESAVSSFANWNYLVPKIVTDDQNFQEYIKLAENQPFSFFTLIQLPVIAVGLTMSTMIIFIAIYFKNDKYTDGLYLAQFVIFIGELFFTIIVTVISKYQLQHLENIWNQDSGIKKSFLDLYNSFQKSETLEGDHKIFYNNFFNLVFGKDAIFRILFIDLKSDSPKINSLWLSSSQYIAESIISFSFAVVATAVIGNKMHLIRKEKNKLLQEHGTE
ncbi:hypothetical protein [Spiroplasma alleghenense]|uniref:Transmembrane protein n=1 Tax=Spiroplasma alleghenense TaxID=216931 RepID=A0A345Z2T9_9MOLU|nr:hypothetical protein [Spiroplasma alleghenense]AXK50918.1 hypothetical protein SALLE_v1c02420 [Spiroplasma alleghenense]